jgi:hypothetical protein
MLPRRVFGIESSVKQTAAMLALMLDLVPWSLKIFSTSYVLAERMLTAAHILFT